MGLQNFYGKGLHVLLLAASWALRGKITVSGVPNRLNCCVIFRVYSQITNVPAGRIKNPKSCGLETQVVRLTECNSVNIDSVSRYILEKLLKFMEEGLLSAVIYIVVKARGEL